MWKPFNDDCLIVFPADESKQLRIYYRELVDEISVSESQYFYSVRPKNGLAYNVLGSEGQIYDHVFHTGKNF
jgi:hypothetical protein